MSHLFYGKYGPGANDMYRHFRKSDIAHIVEALTLAAEYFDRFADANCDGEGFSPNGEMRLQMLCEKALECFSREEAAREARDEARADYYEECKADWQRTGEDE